MRPISASTVITIDGDTGNVTVSPGELGLDCVVLDFPGVAVHVHDTPEGLEHLARQLAEVVGLTVAEGAR